MFPRPLRDFATAVGNLVYPPTCLGCSADIPGPLESHYLCAACFAALSVDPFPTCPRCASSVGPHADTAKGCVLCRHESYRFSGVIRGGPYADRLRDIVLRMKSLPGDALAETAGRLLARKLRSDSRYQSPDAVLAVPLHWRRRLARGYNQAAIVARGIAVELGVPCRPRGLKRIKHTPHQPTQSATARRENVRNSMAVARWATVRGLKVVVVDDVMTTGATLDEAARVLRAAGAAQVWAAVVAHG